MKKNFLIIKINNLDQKKKLKSIYANKKLFSYNNLLIFYDDIYLISNSLQNHKEKITINLNREASPRKIFEFFYFDNKLEILVDPHKSQLFYFTHPDYFILSNDLFILKDFGKYSFSYEKYFQYILCNRASLNFEQTIFENIFSITSNTRYIVNYQNFVKKEKIEIDLKVNENLKSFKDSLLFFSNQIDNLTEKYSNIKNSALLLSSGQDSSILAYYLKKNLINFKCFTIGFPDEYEDWDEFNVAKKYSNHLNLEHTKILFEQKDFEDGLIKAIQFAGYIPVNQSEITFSLASKIIKSFGIENIFNGDVIDLPLGSNFGNNSDILENVKKEHHFNYFKLIYEYLFHKYPFERGFYKLDKIRKELFKYDIEELFSLKYTENRYLKYLNNNFKTKYLILPELKLFIDTIKHNDERLRLNAIDTFLKTSTTHKYENFFLNQEIFNISAYCDNNFIKNILSIPSKFNHKEFTDKVFFSNEKYLMRSLVKSNLPDYLFRRRKYGFGIPIAKMLKQSSFYDYLFSQNFIDKNIISSQKISNLIKNEKDEVATNFLFKLISYEIVEQIFT